jgi:NAD(P)-dependent dehydrogenase (short-subunit alcohol dehydrogenase family)
VTHGEARNPSIIVTGAGNGIGRAVAERLLRQGARVIAVDVDTSGLTEAELPGIITVEGDARSAEVIEEACERAGVVSAVVACAGISRPGPSDTYPRSDWDEMLAINVTAVFDLMVRAARQASEGASFVAISSVTASQGFAGRAAYSASKAAIEGMVRALAVEYAPRIRVNSLSPGFIMTDIARRNIAQGFISNESIVSRTPLGRWGKPEDVAAAVSFLLSDDADWITGAAIPVDGGWLALGM